MNSYRNMDKVIRLLKKVKKYDIKKYYCNDTKKKAKYDIKIVTVREKLRKYSCFDLVDGLYVFMMQQEQDFIAFMGNKYNFTTGYYEIARGDLISCDGGLYKFYMDVKSCILYAYYPARYSGYVFAYKVNRNNYESNETYKAYATSLSGYIADMAVEAITKYF